MKQVDEEPIHMIAGFREPTEEERKKVLDYIDKPIKNKKVKFDEPKTEFEAMVNEKISEEKKEEETESDFGDDDALLLKKMEELDVSYGSEED